MLIVQRGGAERRDQGTRPRVQAGHAHTRRSRVARDEDRGRRRRLPVDERSRRLSKLIGRRCVRETLCQRLELHLPFTVHSQHGKASMMSARQWGRVTIE